MRRLNHSPVSPVFLILALGSALASPAFASGSDPALVPVPIVIEGQTAVAGVGLVTSVDNLAVNNLGVTYVEVDTDNTNTDMDSALIDGGAQLQYQEGQALSAPFGANLNTFDALTLSNTGNTGWNFFLGGTSGSNDDSGIYLNGFLLIQEGAFSLASGFSPGTPYTGFFETKINDLDQVLVMASVDDPAVSSTTDRALVVLDAPGGSLIQETVFLKEGDPAPGVAGEFITDFDTGPHNFDFNNLGDVMFLADITGDTTKNAIIYKNTTILAREGDPSPIAGRTWLTVTSPELALNNAGEYVFSASLSGDSATNLVIVKNGAIFRQEGDTLPDIAPFQLTSFGTAPILIADSGDVLWYGDWDDTDTSKDTGLFLNDKLILQEGELVNGLPITDLRGVQDGHAMSDDGRYILVEVVLNGNVDAALQIDRGPWTNLVGAFAGASGKPILRGSGSLQGGAPVTLCVSDTAPGGFSFLVIGLNAININFLGTTLVPSPDVVVPGLPIGPAGSLQLTAAWPVGVPGGVPLYFQWFIADGGTPQGYAAANAVVGVTP